MPPRRRSTPPPAWTASQVVAHNLACARRLRGWTQELAAERLSTMTGAKWTAVTVAQAEGSVSGDRVRQFTANELVGMARTFDLPISWFFVPPDPGEGPERLDSGTTGGLTWDQLVVLVVGHGGNYTALADRLGHWAATAWRGTTMPIADRLPERSAIAGEGFRQAVTADDVALAAFMGAIRLQFGPRSDGQLNRDMLDEFSSNLYRLQMIIDTLRNYSPREVVRPSDIENIVAERIRRATRAAEAEREGEE